MNVHQACDKCGQAVLLPAPKAECVINFGAFHWRSFFCPTCRALLNEMCAAGRHVVVRDVDEHQQ